MSLNLRRSLDPRWITNHAIVPKGFMIVQISLHRVVDGRAEWDPATGDVAPGNFELIWEGQARVQGNKDWRARHVETAVDPQMVQYARIQIPLTPNNRPPQIETDDVIFVKTPDPESTWRHDEDLTRYTFRVRNALNNSNPWLRNLLCGVDLTEQPNPLGGEES